MAMMGERSVDYHRATVIERADDFAAQSLPEVRRRWCGAAQAQTTSASGSAER
jgi:hypothetical protein